MLCDNCKHLWHMYPNAEKNIHLIANSPTWLKQLLDRLETAERQRKEAVKALERYANEMNWLTNIHGDLNIWHPTYDGTELAAATLKRIKGENENE